MDNRFVYFQNDWKKFVKWFHQSHSISPDRENLWLILSSYSHNKRKNQTIYDETYFVIIPGSNLTYTKAKGELVHNLFHQIKSWVNKIIYYPYNLKIIFEKTSPQNQTSLTKESRFILIIGPTVGSGPKVCKYFVVSGNLFNKNVDAIGYGKGDIDGISPFWLQLNDLNQAFEQWFDC